ncbi:TetR/AcrR family transcriptional regulator [candidate division KSB1 bacterium]|nr:MAG: TetR/AcrR family transcriptional regulator [candidate division KSB1 bacterium]
MSDESKLSAPPKVLTIQAFFNSVPLEWQPPDPESPRGRILNAARILFAEHGLAATSTRMVAEAAAVNLAMIHYYFGSKEQLYEQILAREFITMMRSMSKLIEPTMPPDQIILGLPLRVMAVLQKNPLWITLLRHEVANGCTHLTHALKSLGGFGPLGLRQVFEHTYKAAITQGTLHDLPAK